MRWIRSPWVGQKRALMVAGALASPVWSACIVLVMVSLPATAIINGTVDNTTECVGSLHDTVSLGFLCTGTLIHESWVLTTAQCAALGPNVFAMGPDWASSPRVYLVDYVVPHPSFSGTTDFDFALVHLYDPAAQEPVCASLTPAEDQLSAGFQLRHVGYGLTSYPSGATTQRHSTYNSISNFDFLSIFFDAPVSGPCFGDHGGPALDGSNRVAGVVSAFSETCAAVVLDGRVSVVYDGFILATISSPPVIFHDGFDGGDTSRWTSP